MVTEQKNEDHIQELQEEQKENNYMGKSRKRNIKYEDTNISKKTFLQVNEEDNFEPLIPFGISDIEYLTEDETKLKTGTWVLAKFVTKKSEKHFVSVITIKGTTPEVKFIQIFLAEGKQMVFNNINLSKYNLQ
ncbi:hypothetical protein ACJJTC_004455 [Scirpophaga incertulas]